MLRSPDWCVGATYDLRELSSADWSGWRAATTLAAYLGLVTQFGRYAEPKCLRHCDCGSAKRLETLRLICWLRSTIVSTLSYRGTDVGLSRGLGRLSIKAPKAPPPDSLPKLSDTGRVRAATSARLA